MPIRIIGGGIIGLSVAYHLSTRCEDKIVVYETDKAYERASFARSCGGVRAQFSTPANVAMSRYSIDFIKNQTDVQMTANGYLLLFDESRRSDHDDSLSLQRSLGAATESLSPEELSTLFPVLNVDGIYRGCLTRDGSEGWIDPVALHSWYKHACTAGGVEFVYADYREEPKDQFDKTIICAGYWSREVAKNFGVDLPIKGEKHTVFQVQTSAPQIKALPLIADLESTIYLRPEGDGYIVGYAGNNEGESDNLEPLWTCWDHVWELLYQRFPTIFDEAKMMGAWAGYYDTSTLDQNAVIDGDGNLFYATGFTGRGLMHSPAVGLLVSDLVLEKPPSFDRDIYRLGRHANKEKYVI